LKASQAALKDHLVYCGTKAALDMVSRVMALELGPHKVIFHLKEKPLLLGVLFMVLGTSFISFNNRLVFLCNLSLKLQILF
jgi:hypothetical protein